MGGLTRFERRWAHWIRMRNAMHMQAYDRQRTHMLRRAAMAFLAGFVSMLLLVSGAIIISRPAAAADSIPPHAHHYKLTLKREAQRAWGLQPPVATFAAQVHQESRWQLNARSPAGAHGLAQFMPQTARWISQFPSANLQITDTSNPTWSLRALVTYNLWLHKRIQADNVCERMAYTLSAYNGGLGWVHKRQARSATPGLCMGRTCTINPGITQANQAENELYPRLILIRFETLYSSWGSGSCS